jgi:hypothetical protein
MASDPLADMQNIMGYQGLTGPNPYLPYQGQIPMPQYRGWPTDASGNPIQPTQGSGITATPSSVGPMGVSGGTVPGTTLNSSPATAGASSTAGGGPGAFTGVVPGSPQAQALEGQMGGMDTTQYAAYNAAHPQTSMMSAMGPQWNKLNLASAQNDAINSQTMAGAQNMQGNGFGMTQGGGGGGQGATNLDMARLIAAQRQAGTQQPAAGPQTSGPTADPNSLTRDQYLNLLANPGKVTTPGAQILPGTSMTGPIQSNVLQNFLANNPQGKTGAGGYTNAPFFSTLQGLKQGATP